MSAASPSPTVSGPLDRARAWWGRRGAGQRLLLVALALLPLGLWLLGPMLRPWAISPEPDYFRFVVARAVPGDTIRSFGGVPLRSPLMGGGQSLLSHPHDPTFTPVQWLSYVFGAWFGMKLEILLVWLGGAAGMWHLCRRELALGLPASLFATLMLATQTSYAHHIFGGDIPELWFQLTPLLVALLLAAHRSGRALVGAALVMATLASMTAYRVALTAGFAVLATGMVVALQRPDAPPAERRPLRGVVLAVGLASICAILLALPRLLPSLEAISSQSIRGAGAELQQTYLSFGDVMSRLVIPPNDPSVLREWPLHVGWLVLALALVGLARPRRSAPWLLWALAGAAFCLGDHLPLDPYRLLSVVPGLHSISAVPKQFKFFLICGLILMAAVGVEQLEQLLRRRPLRLRQAALPVLGLLVLAQVVGFGLVGRDLLRQSFHWSLRQTDPEVALQVMLTGLPVLPRPGSTTPDPFQTVYLESPTVVDKEHVALQSEFELPFLLYWLQLGYGNTGWWDPSFPRGMTEPAWIFQENAAIVRANPQYQGELFFDDPGSDCLELVEYHPNRIRARSDCARPSTLVLNQIWLTGWHSNLGTPFEWTGPFEDRPRSMVAIEVPAGPQEIELSYRPWGLRPGLLGFALGWGLLWWAAGRPRQQALPAPAA